VWWLVLTLGTGIVVLGLLSTGGWARQTAGRAAALFEEMGTDTAGTAKASRRRPRDCVRAR
jgi:hypothetical protein